MVYYRKGFNQKGELYYKIEVKYYDTNLKKYRSKTKRFYPPTGSVGNKLIYLVEKEAKEFEMKVNNILESNYSLAIDYMNIKFKDYAISWLEREKKYKGITYYEDHVRMTKYLIEKLGNYKLVDIKPIIIQNLYDKIDERKREIVNIMPRENFMELLNEKGWNRKKIKDNKNGFSTFVTITRGKNITIEKAIEFSKIVDIDIKKLFIVKKSTFHMQVRQI